MARHHRGSGQATLARTAPVTRRHAVLALAVAGLVGCVALANALTSNFGLVWAGPGLTAAAGTYAAGLALGLRDAVHETGGWRAALVAIAAGVVLSVLLGDGRIALASAAAFGLAELADLLVYAPLRRRRPRVAVLASNTVGALLDTLVFLTIAGLPLTGPSVIGQLVVKGGVTLAYLAAREVVTRRGVPRQRLVSARA